MPVTSAQRSPAGLAYMALIDLANDMHMLAQRFEQARAQGRFNAMSDDNVTTASSVITRLRVDAGRLTGIAQYANLTGPSMLIDVMRDHDDVQTYYKWAQSIYDMLPPSST